jgi:predicted transcriptional regulator
MQAERMTIRISRDLRAKIAARAKETQKDPSQIIRDAVEEYLRPSESAYDAFAKSGLIGVVKKGSHDLSTNKKHFAGFARKK